ncbi:MAG: hypothetical protein ACTSVA_03905 [Candidatus Njordarchaeales archaeon]
MNKNLLAALILITPLLLYNAITIAQIVQVYAQAAQPPEINIRFPVYTGTLPREYRDGVVIVGARYPLVLRITLHLPETATENWTDIEILGDGVGQSDYNVTFTPNTEDDPVARLIGPGGNILQQLNGSWIDTWAYFKIPLVKPGDVWRLEYSLYVPRDLPSGVDSVKVTLTIKVKFGPSFEWQELKKIIEVKRPPITRLYITMGLTLGVFVGLLILGKVGFFSIFTTLDLVSIAMIGAAMTVWVQILGRQFIFPITDRIPFAYNFAVADFPYVLLLITAIALVKKPGTASLTLFIYNIVSEIGWYGINPLWWAYPFAQGLPVDLYLLIRGQAVFTNKPIFFRYKIPEEEFESTPDIPVLRIIDGFIIGLLRGFFMQISLYTVFYPNLFRLEYLWEYTFWWIIIPWSIGNAISAAISVPIAEKIREAAQY